MKKFAEADRKVALSDEEMKHLHADDLQAGRIVVGIMTGVFFAGLLLYSLIFWVQLAILQANCCVSQESRAFFGH